MEPPLIYRYLDHRAYLRDWFDWKKASNPRYSHRAFVRRTGQRSPSLLADVIEGRRNLTPAATEAFCRAMSLEPPEATFFTLLTEFGQAKSAAERNRAWDRIAITRRFREARKVEGAGFDYLSHWYYPAIRELAAVPGFRADPAWIVGRLQPPLSEEDAAKALDALLTMGLLVEREGRVEQAEASITTPKEVAGLAVHNYHLGMLKRAHEAVETVKSAERHFVSVTAAVPDALVPVLKRELNAMQERLLELCDGAEEAPDRVVQINLNVFPLTETDP